MNPDPMPPEGASDIEWAEWLARDADRRGKDLLAARYRDVVFKLRNPDPAP